MKKYFQEIKNLSRKLKIFLLVSFDIFFVIISSYLAQSLSLSYFPPYGRVLFLYALTATFFLVLIFKLNNNYNYINRFFDLKSSIKILMSVLLVSFILYIVGLIFELRFFSLGFIISQNSIYFIFSFLFRIYIKFEYYKSSLSSENTNNCLIFGAGRDGLFLSNILSAEKKNIVGFVDEDKSKIGQTLNDIKIYSIFDIKKIITRHKIDECFFCAPSATSFKKKEIFSVFKKLNLNFSTRTIKNFIPEKNILNKFDLKKNKLYKNERLANKFFDKVIFITGAGGSIGQELFFQLYQQEPKMIVAIDNSEYNLSKLKRLVTNFKQDRLKIKLLNVCDLEALKNLFKQENPDFVFHAAAYKHVDIVEENPYFAAKNNILGVLNILEASLKYNVKNFVFISTDKAVNPINIMGMTKKCGEILTKYYASLSSDKQNFSCVRFGNVIGSSGSFVEILKEQVLSGGPITITDKEASRYFMTISDAVNLVIQVPYLKERGNTFVLKMDNPINIFDMVVKFLDENNLKILDEKNPSGNIRIEYTGLRPGEKLHEELFQHNNVTKTSNSLILVEKNNFNITESFLIKFKDDLSRSIKSEDKLLFKETLSSFLNHEK